MIRFIDNSPDYASFTEEDWERYHSIYWPMEGLFKAARNNHIYGDKIPSIYKQHAKQCEELEYLMQDFWGFERDSSKHHYWWKLPGCMCPKIDNKERWGTGYYIFSADCPYHGDYQNECI